MRVLASINKPLFNNAVDLASEERKAKAFAALEDRFDKSKRGPALELVVKPSNYLLLCGVLTCVMALGGSFWSVFPMIFKVEKVNNDKKAMYGAQTSKKVYEEALDALKGVNPELAVDPASCVWLSAAWRSAS